MDKLLNGFYNLTLKFCPFYESYFQAMHENLIHLQKIIRKA